MMSTATKAFEPAPYYFIGISHGAIAMAKDTFNRILAHPLNFPTVGDPMKEVAPSPEGISIAPLMDQSRRSVSPNCSTRRHFAEHLAQMFLELMVLHEFAHIANGHVAYLTSIGKTAPQLAPISDADFAERRLWQTIEMDADAGSIGFALTWNDIKRRALLSSRWTDPAMRRAHEMLYGTKEAYIKSILLVGCIFFRTFNQPWDSEAQKVASHPQQAIRMKFLADGLLQHVEREWTAGYTTDRYYADAGNVFGAVDMAIAHMEGKERDKSIWSSAFETPLAAEYFFSLEDVWETLQPELEKFALMQELPKVDRSKFQKPSAGDSPPGDA